MFRADCNAAALSSKRHSGRVNPCDSIKHSCLICRPLSWKSQTTDDVTVQSYLPHNCHTGQWSVNWFRHDKHTHVLHWLPCWCCVQPHLNTNPPYLVCYLSSALSQQVQQSAAMARKSICCLLHNLSAAWTSAALSWPQAQSTTGPVVTIPLVRLETQTGYYSLVFSRLLHVMVSNSLLVTHYL